MNIVLPDKITGFRSGPINALRDAVAALIPVGSADIVYTPTRRGMFSRLRRPPGTTTPRVQLDYTRVKKDDEDEWVDYSVAAAGEEPAHPEKLDTTKVEPGEMFYYEYDDEIDRICAKVICMPV
jgi:hypothetical protein